MHCVRSCRPEALRFLLGVTDSGDGEKRQAKQELVAKENCWSPWYSGSIPKSCFGASDGVVAQPSRIRTQTAVLVVPYRYARVSGGL